MVNSSRTTVLSTGKHIGPIRTREVYKVPQLLETERLSDHLIGKFGIIPTRKGIKKAIKKGWITIDGRQGYTADLISGGEVIELVVETLQYPASLISIKMKVLYEDEYMAVIDKPAGITVSGNQKRNIVNALPSLLTRSKIDDATMAPQPVHRLDHPTTGVLLIGKTRSAIRKLNQLFEERQISKKYVAISIGNMMESGEINTPIDGQDAKTKYRLITSVASDRFGQLNLVVLTPHTGRRHQIRKHLAYLEGPILGDKLYGIDDLILKGKGLYLHALSISLCHPNTKEELHIASPLPLKFIKIFPKAEEFLLGKKPW